MAGAEKKQEGWGDVWTWTAIDADTKLCVSYLVGGRDGGWAKDFMEDCAKRIRNRVQITTEHFSTQEQWAGRPQVEDLRSRLLWSLLPKQWASSEYDLGAVGPPVWAQARTLGSQAPVVPRMAAV